MADCIFCEIAQGRGEASLVYQDATCLAFMDLYPVRPGHVLVIPRRHAMFIGELDGVTRGHLFEVGNAVINAQKAAGLPCDGHNLYLNDGPAANQHVPHVHLHVLPRQQGDLLKAAFTFSTRFVNHFGQAAHRRRLDELAQRIAQHMPQQV